MGKIPKRVFLYLTIVFFIVLGDSLSPVDVGIFAEPHNSLCLCFLCVLITFVVYFLGGPVFPNKWYQSYNSSTSYHGNREGSDKEFRVCH